MFWNIKCQLVDGKENGPVIKLEYGWTAGMTDEEIAEVVARWTGIPVSKMLEGDREKLLRMESVLHVRVIGQNEAVDKVSKDTFIFASCLNAEFMRSFQKLLKEEGGCGHLGVEVLHR